jgi:Tol biopolymer transport system component
VKAWLGFLAILPVLAFPSGTTATSSDPPRNGLIAAFSVEGMKLIDPAGGSARELPGTEEMSDPAWSPDGKSLALIGWSDDEAFGVYTMKADGSDRRLVLRDATSPGWSPDGERLVAVREACADRDGCSSDDLLVTVRADGTDLHDLTPDGATSDSVFLSPAWSPDGKSIAFVDAENRIKVVSADGQADTARQVATDASSVAWSPDGSRLAFDRYVDEGGASAQVVVVLDLATGKETVLRGAEDRAEAPVWSPDGMQLAFLSSKAPVVTGGCGGGHVETRLWVMAADGTKAHRIAKGFFFGTPSWARSVEPAAPAA